MYSEEDEDPLYRKLSKILELTSLIFGHYKNTGQKERAHSLIVWVVSALQAVIEHRQRLSVADPGFSPGGCQLPKWVCQPIFLAENCMKMKEFGPPGGSAHPWCPP